MSSLKDVKVPVLLLFLGSKSEVGAELEERILETEGVQKVPLRILDLKERYFQNRQHL